MTAAEVMEKLSEGSEAKAAKIPPESKVKDVEADGSDSDDDDEEMPGLEDSANADVDKKGDVSSAFIFLFYVAVAVLQSSVVGLIS